MHGGAEQYNAAAWLVDRHVASGRGDRIAIRCQGRSTTYGELLEEVWRAQHLLAGLGLDVGDRFAMVVQDDETFPAFFLGGLRSGLVPVPLSTMLRGEALGEIVADSGAAVAVVSETFSDAIPGLVAGAPVLEHLVVIGDAAIDGAERVRMHRWSDATDRSEAHKAETSRDTRAFWLYSSGTTGVPKGVMHRHGHIEATVHHYADPVLEITPDDRFLSVAKLFFAYGLGNSLTFPFAVGATAILNPAPPTPGDMAALIADERATLFFSSPGFCAALLDAGLSPDTFASVRASITAGESLPANVQTRFAELTGSPVLDGIGSTELLHIFISNRLDRQVPGSSGWLCPGYDAELRDDDGEVIDAVDMPGYLHVQGDSAAVGYWQRPEATAAAFVDGWVRTGDVYVRGEQDEWTFLGRNNDMIKAGGIWVSPAEVESVLIEHESVLEAAVVGARDDQGLETVVAFVLPASGATVDSEVLLAHCRDRMEAFKRPRRIVGVDELPKTATGKIRRFELRDRLT